MDFETAFAKLIGNEGGYTVDSGGPTRYGVSQRSYPHEKIDENNPTLARAHAIYYKDFWGPAGCDVVPDILKFELFDLAVNTSSPGVPKTAIRILQRAAGLSPAATDGIIGTVTLMAIQALPPWRLYVHFIGERILYYTSLNDPLWHEAGKGWMNRVAHNCVAM